MILPIIEESQSKEYKTKEEIQEMINRLKIQQGVYNNEQLAIKLIINSMYGATANIYFAAYNINIATSITLQGQELIKFAEEILNNYFLNLWHLDYELHAKMGLKQVKKVSMPVVVYIDTDSVDAKSKIRFKQPELGIEDEICIADLFERCSKIQDVEFDERGNELIKFDNSETLLVENYDKVNDCDYFGDVRRIIRHKVYDKEQYEIISESGKKVVITGDHSIIVSRNGKILELKPSELLENDILLENDEIQ